MTIKKLLLAIAISQFSQITLAADEAPVPTKAPLDSEQQQLLNLGTKVVQNGVDWIAPDAVDTF